MSILFFVITLFVPAQSRASVREPVSLCPGVVLSATVDPDFSDVEKGLICGEKSAWKSIPRSQKEFSLRTFLEQRGFYHARFVESPDHVFVDIGDPTYVRSIAAPDAPPTLVLERRRKIIGALLTPDLLNDVEHWVTQELQAAGYACPKVSSEANPDTGHIIVHTDAGSVVNLVHVDEDEIPGLERGVLQRYNAFVLGDRFNQRWLSLTENRILADRQVESAHFTNECRSDGVYARERFVAGPPRLLTFGFGLNTEGVFLGRAGWRNTRLGKRGSILDFSAQGSVRGQKLSATADVFFLPAIERISFRPTALVEHQNERFFETADSRVETGLARSWDAQNIGGTIAIGPAFDLVHTFRGQGPVNSRFLALGTSGRIESHAFEFYNTSPRSGFNVELITAFTTRQLLSDASVQHLGARGEWLFNFMNFDPPLLVFGARVGFTTNFTAERPGPGIHIPPNLLEFLGGAHDLRGFALQELPKNGFGQLTSGYTSLECRLVSTLPYNIEPFLFTDIGALGHAPGQFDRPIYWSPGLGARWPSPIGVFRGTAAHGYPSEIGHFQFYLSFGEEF